MTTVATNGESYLSLAEVEMYAYSADLVQIPTVGALSVQTTLYAPPYQADNALDGNPNTFTHTAGPSTEPGWQALLPRSEIISRIVVGNRLGCCPERFSDITIEILSGANATSLLNYNLSTGGTVVFNSGVWNANNSLEGPRHFQFDFPVPVRGNFIRVRRLFAQANLAPEFLSISEVEIYGLTKEAEFCGNPFGNCATYCVGLGERSGCSGCVGTKGTCTWCSDPNNDAVGACVLAGRGTTCGTDVLSTRISGWEEGNHNCPSNPLAEPKLNGKSLSAKHREHSFSFAFDSQFCDFPTEPWFVDKWSNAPALTAFTLTSSSPCSLVNTHFGLFPGAKTKEDMLELVDENCRTDTNPLASGRGRECMRLMQSAYCSANCPAYGSPRGRPCFDWDNLFRACGAWASPFDRIPLDVDPLNNGCPLDPNNLLKAASFEAKCDPNMTVVKYSGLWEETFGLYEPLEVEVAE
jgi:hypothetical protein